PAAYRPDTSAPACSRMWTRRHWSLIAAASARSRAPDVLLVSFINLSLAASCVRGHSLPTTTGNDTVYGCHHCAMGRHCAGLGRPDVEGVSHRAVFDPVFCGPKVNGLCGGIDAVGHR